VQLLTLAFTELCDYLNFLILAMCRLLKEVMSHGKFNVSRVPGSPLPPYSFLSATFFAGCVLLSWSSRQGRRFYLSSLAFFTFVTFASAMLS